MEKYKTEDNTADIAISARGKTIEELFANLAHGLIEEMVDVKSINVGAYCNTPLREKIIISFTDYENALIQFLNKIIYFIDVENKIPQEFKLKFSKNSLTAEYLSVGSCPKSPGIKGQAPQNSSNLAKPDPFLDNFLHKKRYIKAATYYDIKIKKTKGGFKTKVVFDV